MKVKILSKFNYQLFPQTKDMIEISEEDLKQIGLTKCFDVDNKTLIEYDNSQEIAKKQQIDYENKIVAEIRKKYTVNQELAILRQRDTKPEEFAEYNEYVESCKAKIKEEI